MVQNGNKLTWGNLIAHITALDNLTTWNKPSSIVLELHGLLELAWFHRVHPRELSFLLSLLCFLTHKIKQRIISLMESEKEKEKRVIKSTCIRKQTSTKLAIKFLLGHELMQVQRYPMGFRSSKLCTYLGPLYTHDQIERWPNSKNYN